MLQFAYPVYSDKLLVKEDPSEYNNINQGCLTVDNMDDKEEMRLADVCKKMSEPRPEEFVPSPTGFIPIRVPESNQIPKLTSVMFEITC